MRQEYGNQAGDPDALGGEETEATRDLMGQSANRRRALKLGAAAAAALAGGAVAAEKARAHGTQGDITSNNADPAIHGINTAGGPAILGETTTGSGPGGVQGRSAGLAPGVRGDSDHGFGVEGKGELGGVRGFADGENREAVRGDAPSGKGVVGISNDIVGVAGFGGPTGVSGVGTVGVHGVGVTGVKAELAGFASNGFALEVIGKASFSTAGAGSVPAGASSASVANPAVTADSHVTVTLTGDPGPAELRWVERQPGSGFVVHLSRKAQSATPFTYVIVEP